MTKQCIWFGIFRTFDDFLRLLMFFDDIGDFWWLWMPFMIFADFGYLLWFWMTLDDVGWHWVEKWKMTLWSNWAWPWSRQSCSIMYLFYNNENCLFPFEWNTLLYSGIDHCFFTFLLQSVQAIFSLVPWTFLTWLCKWTFCFALCPHISDWKLCCCC